MDRTVDFLLNNYYYKDKKTERLAPGELWSTEHAVKNMREQRTYERLNKLETIINDRMSKSRGTFNMPKAQKDRARYLIKHLDFAGRTTEYQYIVMIIIYVKLESNHNARPIHYYPMLEEYGIPVTTFISFLVKLNKFHLEN